MKDYVADNPSEGCIAFIKEENTWSGEKVSPTLAEYADKARKDKAPNDWLCNHVSLAGSPKSNAQYLNPIATEYILSNPGRTAIVMLDYACDDAIGGDVLVNAIVNQNVRYKQAAK